MITPITKRYSRAFSRFPHRWFASLVILVTAPGWAGNWPAWRGPEGTGVSTENGLPVRWDQSENVRWRVTLPERGNSTPIVWDNRVFITQAIEKEGRRTVMCFDRAAGKLLWQAGVIYKEKEVTHATNPYCSTSPVTDGEHLIVNFGSFGLYCLDLDGTVLWQADFGPMQSLHGHGEGSSPALFGQTLIVNWDHEGKSFVVALDKATGNQIWKVDRQEVTSWATPIIVEQAGRAQVIISGTSRIRDQISIPRRGVTAEEVLLRLRRLRSGYEYQLQLGLTYTFGSIFNTMFGSVSIGR